MMRPANRSSRSSGASRLAPCPRGAPPARLDDVWTLPGRSPWQPVQPVDRRDRTIWTLWTHRMRPTRHPSPEFLWAMGLPAFFWYPQKLRGGSRAALGSIPIFCRSLRQRDRHLLRPFDVALTEAGPYAHA